MRFMHCLRDRDWLIQALSEGLMFTEHKINYWPASKGAQHQQALRQEVLPLLSHHLQLIGCDSTSLTPAEVDHLFEVLGDTNFLAPMLCFTEVPDGRNLLNQYRNFGAFGLVMKRDWIEQQGGDRVQYVGDGSPITKRLHRLLAAHYIAGLYTDINKKPLFLNRHIAFGLDFLMFVQQRSNLEETEWRIPGKHGLMGGNCSTGRRLPFELDAVEYVLVRQPADVVPVAEALEEIRKTRGDPGSPEILVQPDTLPARSP